MTDALRTALATIGTDDDLRAQVIALCHSIERAPQWRGTKVRDELTGPILDALHEHTGRLRKTLSNGLLFDFFYRSRIARDFVMSIPDQPDHVWEPQTTRLLVHLSGGAEHVIVGGAYFGDHAIPVAHRMRPHGGIVHAFEPDEGPAEMLEHNAQINGLTNVRVVRAALWREPSARLTLQGDDALKTAEPAPDGDTNIDAMTIDQYLAAENIDRVQWIIVDVEGGELDALRGAEGQLSLPAGRAPHVVFEVHSGRDDWSKGLQNTEVHRYVASFGYTIYALRDIQSNADLRGRPIELVPPETAYLAGPPHGFNMFAVKDPSILENELFRIVPDVSPKLLRHRDPALHAPTGGF
jgi:FkbM family methyltransferase